MIANIGKGKVRKHGMLMPFNYGGKKPYEF